MRRNYKHSILRRKNTMLRGRKVRKEDRGSGGGEDDDDESVKSQSLTVSKVISRHKELYSSSLLPYETLID